MNLGKGSRIGPFEVLSALGEGGMGEVFRARDAKLGRDVALKLLPARWHMTASRWRGSSAKRARWPR